VNPKPVNQKQQVKIIKKSNLPVSDDEFDPFEKSVE